MIIPIEIMLIFALMLILPVFNVLINIVVRNEQEKSIYTKKDIIINNFYLFFAIFGSWVKFALSIHPELNFSRSVVYFCMFVFIINILSILLVYILSIKNIILFLLKKETLIKPFTRTILIMSFTICMLTTIPDIIIVVYAPILFIILIIPLGIQLIMIIYFFKALKTFIK